MRKIKMSSCLHDKNNKNGEKFISFAIDGPSGAGKSSLAKGLANKFGFWYLDTGALYRALGVYLYEAGIGSGEKEKIEARIDGESENIKIEAVYKDGEQKTFLNGTDVSVKIREHHMSKFASDISRIPKVRKFLRPAQQDAAEKDNIVMDGRDIGTVILPNADVKIFLTATPEERAKRRFDELKAKGQDVNYGDILRDITERDEQDSQRGEAPLIPAKDAIPLDNSDCSRPEESLERAVKIIKEKLPDVCIW